VISFNNKQHITLSKSKFEKAKDQNITKIQCAVRSYLVRKLLKFRYLIKITNKLELFVRKNFLKEFFSRLHSFINWIEKDDLMNSSEEEQNLTDEESGVSEEVALNLHYHICKIQAIAKGIIFRNNFKRINKLKFKNEVHTQSHIEFLIKPDSIFKLEEEKKAYNHCNKTNSKINLQKLPLKQSFYISKKQKSNNLSKDLELVRQHLNNLFKQRQKNIEPKEHTIHRAFKKPIIYQHANISKKILTKVYESRQKKIFNIIKAVNDKKENRKDYYSKETPRTGRILMTDETQYKTENTPRVDDTILRTDNYFDNEETITTKHLSHILPPKFKINNPITMKKRNKISLKYNINLFSKILRAYWNKKIYKNIEKVKLSITGTERLLISPKIKITVASAIKKKIIPAYNLTKEQKFSIIKQQNNLTNFFNSKKNKIARNNYSIHLVHNEAIINKLIKPDHEISSINYSLLASDKLLKQNEMSSVETSFSILCYQKEPILSHVTSEVDHIFYGIEKEIIPNEICHVNTNFNIICDSKHKILLPLSNEISNKKPSIKSYSCSKDIRSLKQHKLQLFIVNSLKQRIEMINQEEEVFYMPSYFEISTYSTYYKVNHSLYSNIVAEKIQKKFRSYIHNKNKANVLCDKINEIINVRSIQKINCYFSSKIIINNSCLKKINLIKSEINDYSSIMERTRELVEEKELLLSSYFSISKTYNINLSRKHSIIYKKITNYQKYKEEQIKQKAIQIRHLPVIKALFIKKVIYSNKINQALFLVKSFIQKLQDIKVIEKCLIPIPPLYTKVIQNITSKNINNSINSSKLNSNMYVKAVLLICKYLKGFKELKLIKQNQYNKKIIDLINIDRVINDNQMNKCDLFSKRIVLSDNYQSRRFTKIKSLFELKLKLISKINDSLTTEKVKGYSITKNNKIEIKNTSKIKKLIDSVDNKIQFKNDTKLGRRVYLSKIMKTLINIIENNLRSNIKLISFRKYKRNTHIEQDKLEPIVDIKENNQNEQQTHNCKNNQVINKDNQIVFEEVKISTFKTKLQYITIILKNLMKRVENSGLNYLLRLKLRNYYNNVCIMRFKSKLIDIFSAKLNKKFNQYLGNSKKNKMVINYT